MENSLIITSDGSHTIYVPDLDEHYHSIYGAIAESEHIFIKAGYHNCVANPISIFEAGFGTGLNALITALESYKYKSNRTVYYTGIEKYPLADDIISQINYHKFLGVESGSVFRRIHSSSWESCINICGSFYLKKIKADLTDFQFAEKYDLIYFDAFGPLKQPEMWTRDVISNIASATNTNGIFMTYSARGEVRRNLESCGFKVSLLPGPAGKRQIIRAIKI
ncbi:MAG TPA: tRNA (5-methylaminomethyl-2-thiouridine)(34)-methyltransferase MnmD [Bacteroidales bacterium]|nr:tRNA (5-methylaminomethyl-2-thiouridine)(34)-methyltransferase MnmD [Bacteroidales bacterium]